MDEERAQIFGDEVDRFRNLPDDLLHKILLNLQTKEVVKCSVLSKRWGDLWPLVPGLDLMCADFPDRNAFVSFIDRFLGFNYQSCLQNFKLEYQRLELMCEWKWNEADIAHVTRWIDVVLKRKVQHLHLLESMSRDKEVEIPLTVYTCKSLVSLNLCKVVLLKPKSVFLPFLRIIYLDRVKLANDWAFEMLISGCPVLESLTIYMSPFNNVKVLRVCSQSLLSFSHFRDPDEDQVVVIDIDAPRLEYLMLNDYETEINNLDSLVKADIGIMFNLSSERRLNPNDLPKRNMVRDFLIGISRVKDMVISLDTLQVIYNLSQCEQLPLLRNPSSLDVSIDHNKWEMLPIFLERCPNLKFLYLHLCRFLAIGKEERVNILPGPRRFLTSLEYVSIAMPRVKETTMMELASYFLENSTILDAFEFYLYVGRKMMNLHGCLRVLY